ncbi:arginase family protein, partial [Vibrio parahaemolyticus]|uniref:arginase family protein n=1 Tax=Vibrio parahaemolyticus TaxID=670 RepID=UPI000AC5A2AC
SYDYFAPFLDRILSHYPKMMLADIAAYNPTYDIDSQTARLAARLSWAIANALNTKF